MRSFDSAREALQYIEASDDQLKLSAEDTLLFRGETKLYPAMLPSVMRVSEYARWKHLQLIHNLTEHLIDDVLAQFLELRDDGPYYKGTWIGRPDWNDAILSGSSYIQIKWQLESLLQHYGWATPWLDITFDPRVAMFFASLDYPKRSLIREGVGYIHIWSLKAIRSSYLYLEPIADLCPMASVLSEVFGVPSSRPRAQLAASIRVLSPGVEEGLRELRETICFKRQDTHEIVNEFSDYFPDDKLPEALDAFEQQYLVYCKSVPAASVDPSWPDFVRFLEEWRARDRS